MRESEIAELIASAFQEARDTTEHWFSAPNEETPDMRAYFFECAKIGTKTDDLRMLFQRLQTVGQAYEPQCPQHSAVYLLGLLSAVMAHGEARENFRAPFSVFSLLGSAARKPTHDYFEALTEENARTMGDQIYLRYGLQGVRGEASGSLSVLTLHFLPAWEENIRNGMDTSEASARAFLYLLSLVKDTSAVSLLGMEKTDALSEQAKSLKDTASADEIRQFGKELQALRFPLNGYISLLACGFAIQKFCTIA